MAYDLVIANGTVVDGSGAPGCHADVGIADGRIAAIGDLKERAKETLDAEGHVVAPGFVDGHTHMDAQVFWDPIGSCSCYHGVTSVVMGNCGFTLAPCRESEADLVFRNLERAEDIAREAMLAGIQWRWETFPQYLDVLDSLPKGINYAGYLGHSALRTYVMGQRAFEEEASESRRRAHGGDCRRAVVAVRAGHRPHQRWASPPRARRTTRRRTASRLRAATAAAFHRRSRRASAGRPRRSPRLPSSVREAAVRRDWAHRRRHVRDRRRSGGRRSRAPRRLPRPPEGAGGGNRRAGDVHVGPLRQPKPRRAGALAQVPGAARRAASRWRRRAGACSRKSTRAR